MGYIPQNSNKQHLGIVLGSNSLTIKYCYCTTKSGYTRVFNDDFIIIPAHIMKAYFTNPQDTYIFLSPRYIFEMLIITFLSRLDSEYEAKPMLDKNVFDLIITKIKNSDNLPQRFKDELLEFIAEN